MHHLQCNGQHAVFKKKNLVLEGRSETGTTCQILCEDPVVQLENCGKKSEAMPLFHKRTIFHALFLPSDGLQSRRGAEQGERCPVLLTAVLCPVLLSAPDSWIYNCVPGKSHSVSNRWKHPSPNSSMALGSHVEQGKGGGSLGALGCRSQLPLSNFRRGVQEQCGVENFPNPFLKAAISE